MDNDLPAAPTFTPQTPEPALAAPPPTKKPRFWNHPTFQTCVSIFSIASTLGICVGLYARANNFGQQVVENHPVDARIVFTNPPTYLDPNIISALKKEAYDYASQDDATYDRVRNPQDATLLHDLANLYAGTTTEGTQVISRQTLGFNAWIKSITSVRREVAKDKSIQDIQITAEWRSPVAWVYAADTFYLIDDQGVRLPGDYKAEDRRGSRLLVIAGLDLPQVTVDQQVTSHIPLPGEGWFADNGHLAPDLTAGLKLAQVLSGQTFSPDINGIDVSNMSGRHDPTGPWITLQSMHTTSQGAPTLVYWGRPIGEEKFYEVKAAIKLKNLTEIYQKYNAIDAGHDYVDLRTEQILMPKPLASGQ